MNPNLTSGPIVQPARHHPGGWSRVVTATAVLALGIGGLVACGTAQPTSSAQATSVASIATSTTAATEPQRPTSTVIPTTSRSTPTSQATVTSTTSVYVPACRTETAPIGPDSHGVVHTGEKICTWGPELRSHLDSRNFVDGSENHPVDLAMSERCWAMGGRVYLRTPAVDGWACIGDHA